MCQKLSLGNTRIMLGTRHLHHPASLALKNIEKSLAPLRAIAVVPNADLLVDQWEASPTIFAALRTKHGVGAEDVEIGWEVLQQEVFRELLDGEDFSEQRVTAEALDWEGAEDGGGRENGGGEENNIGMLLAEIIGIGEERSAERGCDGRVIGTGMSD